MRTIVFFTQSLGKTGSEIALYKLLSKGIKDTQIHVVTIYKGEFIKQLPAEITIHCLMGEGNRHTIAGRIYNALKKKALLKKIIGLKANFWYINTIVFPDILSLAKSKGIPVIMHIHELEQMYFTLNDKQTQELLEYPFKIAACSEAAAGVLRIMGRKKNISVIHPSYLNRIPSEKKFIPQAEFIWLMAGSTDANKNPLLFVKVAEKVIKSADNAVFIWLYSGEENGYLYFCRKYAEHVQIADKLLFVRAGNDYSAYFNAAYGVLITSSRESFSLVALEALSSGKPVVSTDCGGVTELITNETGTIVQSTQPADFAAAIMAYMKGTKPYNKGLALERSIQYSEEHEYKKWHAFITDHSQHATFD